VSTPKNFSCRNPHGLSSLLSCVVETWVEHIWSEFLGWQGNERLQEVLKGDFGIVDLSSSRMVYVEVRMVGFVLGASVLTGVVVSSEEKGMETFCTVPLTVVSFCLMLSCVLGGISCAWLVWFCKSPQNDLHQTGYL